MLREFSNRIRHSNEALEETTQAWMRLMIILYLLKSWSPDGKTDHVQTMTELTGKDPGEVEDVLEGLSGEGIVVLQNGGIVAFDREAVWESLASRQSRH